MKKMSVDNLSITVEKMMKEGGKVLKTIYHLFQ